jgi:hypothetical protein
LLGQFTPPVDLLGHSFRAEFKGNPGFAPVAIKTGRDQIGPVIGAAIYHGNYVIDLEDHPRRDVPAVLAREAVTLENLETGSL